MKLSDDHRWFLVGERRIPLVHVDHDNTPLPPGPSFRVRRVLVKGEGWALSIIWGDGTHSSNYNAFMYEKYGSPGFLGPPAAPFTEEPTMVEAMIVDGPMTEDEPRDYLDADMLLDLIDELERRENANDPGRRRCR